MGCKAKNSHHQTRPSRWQFQRGAKRSFGDDRTSRQRKNAKQSQLSALLALKTHFMRKSKPNPSPFQAGGGRTEAGGIPTSSHFTNDVSRLSSTAHGTNQSRIKPHDPWEMYCSERFGGYTGPQKLDGRLNPLSGEFCKGLPGDLQRFPERTRQWQSKTPMYKR